MRDRYLQMTKDQLSEQRMEIETRIKNLFWTVSGDYTLDVKPDLNAFAKSRYIALYDAIKQGAFAKYFEPDKLSLYLMKKIYCSANERALTELAQLCVDTAVYPLAAKEREGIDGIRRRAFQDILKQWQPAIQQTFFTQVKRLMFSRWLGEGDGEATDDMKRTADAIGELKDAKDTDEIIRMIDKLYNTVYDRAFEQERGSLGKVLKVTEMELAQSAWQDFLTDEQMDKALKKVLAGMGKRAMRLDIDGRRKASPSLSELEQDTNAEGPALDEAAINKLQEYVALHFGRSRLTPLEQERVNRRLCRGIHANCTLYFTEGILHNPLKKNNQYRFAQMQYEKNRMYYGKNHRIIKRNIANLADALKKTLAMRSQDDSSRRNSGQLVPSRLWKLGRTADEKLFDKKIRSNNSDFVIDVLLDSSGSQMKRQSQVAIQGYIISDALSAAGIPHRVVGYCTFWGHTVMHRFRDYDDAREMNGRLFEFKASGDNRDGLAIKTAYDSLLNRSEENKILIVLSDGRPSDLGSARPGTKNPRRYFGEEAVRDTAFEVRRARAFGIAVLGIFTGSDEDLSAEKKIYGKDFAYIRNIRNFSHIVGTYLRRQMERE